MPRPALRSRSRRKLKKRTPSGRHVTHYEQRKPKAASCACCKKALHGITRERAIRMKKTARTRRKVSRPFGGNMCSACSRQEVKSRIFRE